MMHGTHINTLQYDARYIQRKMSSSSFTLQLYQLRSLFGTEGWLKTYALNANVTKLRGVLQAKRSSTFTKFVISLRAIYQFNYLTVIYL